MQCEWHCKTELAGRESLCCMSEVVVSPMLLQSCWGSNHALRVAQVLVLGHFPAFCCCLHPLCQWSSSFLTRERCRPGNSTQNSSTPRDQHWGIDSAWINSFWETVLQSITWCSKWINKAYCFSLPSDLPLNMRWPHSLWKGTPSSLPF